MQGPTPEQCGRRILKVCRDNYLRAGEQLLLQLLRLSLLDTNEFPPEALIAGLQWLVDNGYLEERGPLQSGYVLTPKGFAALQGM
ncbi:MAG TPA: hypothetical protein VGX03_02245 [Candidatus Binatia bacterium]|jgi:hypothetical protein|nr:hypothetical protein [Candidatus Binatia bacterium]